jgi:Tol biopolymer transport system component
MYFYELNLNLMNLIMNKIVKFFAYCLVGTLAFSCNKTPNLGIFEGNGDIGNVKYPGSVNFNPSDSTYTVSGGGTNMWFNKDELHYVWKQMSGDVSLAADIKWVGKGLEAHRKACLIIRQSLDTSSAYADAAVHGDGLTSIQYREVDGDITREVQSNVTAPDRVRIEKEGDYISMSIAHKGEEFHSSGGTFRLHFKEPFYVGLGVCSHNNDTIETAIFSNVHLKKLTPKPDSLKHIESTLETIPIASFDRRVVRHFNDHIEAPNWSPDGKTLVYNSHGSLFKISVEGGEPEQIPTGFARRINNDHGISPDGKYIVISDQTESGSSMIYSLPFEGGEPKKITNLSPSYWHGWSPDGKMLAYCAERKGNYDIYTIPFAGGKEMRLTSSEGLDDGPDYSPDGTYIYFNSERTGTMQVWRMKTDGSEQEQVTTDELNDWFPHPSPDGKWLTYITFEKEVPAGSHPPNKNVMLRLMDLETKEVRVMAKLFGGQGTINVPSWSPDSQRFAFVSYRLK